jgi:hypothetical protein
MARAIREYRERTGHLVGLKPAGGIPRREGVAGLARPDQGRAGRPLAPARPVPLRRERATNRHRASARALRDRPVFGGAHRTRPPRLGMASIPEIFETMAYGPAPEWGGRRRTRGWTRTGGASGLLHRRGLGPLPRARASRPSTRQRPSRWLGLRQRGGGGGTGGAAARAAPARVVGLGGPRPGRATSTRWPRQVQKHSRSVRGARVARQRQADPGIADIDIPLWRGTSTITQAGRSS